MRRLVTATAAAAVALSAHLAVPPSAQADDARTGEPRAATVRLLTNGFGHGRGLSQYGAQARAKLGHTRQEILRFYYPGLATGSSSGSMKVLITADTSSDVVVVDRAGLSVRSLGTGKAYRLDSPAAAKRWKIVAASGGRSTVAWRAATGSWRTWRTLAGQAEFSAGGLPITLVTPSGNASYRGALRSALPTASSTTRDTVNVVPLESYLRGVVPREVFASWRAAALQAQAVAARTYAAFERDDRSDRYFHVDDTTSSQVYGGYADEVDTTNAAIKATAGQVLTSGGRPAFTQFSSSNGGWSSAGSMPYLVAQQDPYEVSSGNPNASWTTTVTDAQIEKQWPQIGDLTQISLTRDGNGDLGGRITSATFTGTAGSAKVTGDDFRYLMGTGGRSTWFKLEKATPRDLVARLVPWAA